MRGSRGWKRRDHRLDRGARHAGLIGGGCVPLNLAQAGVPTDRRDDVRRASGLGKAAEGGLAEPVRRCSFRQTSLVAHLAKPIGESGGRERLTGRRRQEREVVSGGCLQHGGKLRVYWNYQFGTGLLLSQM